MSETNDFYQKYHNTQIARYYTNELSFICPKGFLDQTFHVFNQPESTPDPFNIVISRNYLIEHADTLEDLSQYLLRTMEINLAHFTLTQYEKEEQIIDGIPAYMIEYHWRKLEEGKECW